MTGRELGVGADLVLLEDLVGELEERTLVCTQGFRRHALQVLIDAATHVGQRRDLLLVRARLLLQSCLDLHIHGPDLRQLGKQGLDTSFEGRHAPAHGGQARLELRALELLGLVPRAPALGLEAHPPQRKARVHSAGRDPEEQTHKSA